MIQIASAQGDEGKTLVTVHTALALAQAGARVLVVDADLHRPRCHRLLGVMRAPGLADVLGGAPFADCLQSVALPPTGAPGGRLDLLAVGGSGVAPSGSLAGPGLGKAVQAARTMYDHVLVDSPPLLAVADGLLLAAMADGVLLVIRNETTPRPVVKQAMARLARVGARVLGAVLTTSTSRRCATTTVSPIPPPRCAPTPATPPEGDGPAPSVGRRRLLERTRPAARLPRVDRAPSPRRRPRVPRRRQRVDGRRAGDGGGGVPRRARCSARRRTWASAAARTSACAKRGAASCSS